MNEVFVSRFMESKGELRKKFAEKFPDHYKDIVQAVIEIVQGDDFYGVPSARDIVELDHGDYQGTLLYVMPEAGYQPYNYYYVRVSYGSCSGCDTLMSLRDMGWGNPTEEDKEAQLDGLMTLALHVVQGLKSLDGEVV
jgi:hypothetical protein